MIPSTIIKLLQHKLIRFFLVSGINTVFGYGLFAMLVYFKFSYPLALFLSTIAGILFNFKTTGVIVFKNNNNKLIYKFFCVYGITYLFNVGGLALLKSFHISTYTAGALLLIPIGLLAFLLNKTFVFKNNLVIIKNDF